MQIVVTPGVAGGVGVYVLRKLLSEDALRELTARSQREMKLFTEYLHTGRRRQAADVDPLVPGRGTPTSA